MWRLHFIFAVAAGLAVRAAAAEGPEQVHITLANTEDSVHVTWAQPHLDPSIGLAAKVLCWYGTSPGALDTTVPVKPYTYTDGGYNGTLFTTTFTKLPFSSTVYYRCGSPATGISPLYNMRTKPKTGTEETQRIASFGDAGQIGLFHIMGPGKTFAGVADDVLNRDFQLIINVGDSGYADDYTYLSAPWGNNSWAFDAYFKSMENFTTVVPYMSCPGNHEAQYNFSGYLNRFIHPIVRAAVVLRLLLWLVLMV